jgi:hypothetical protein
MLNVLSAHEAVKQIFKGCHQYLSGLGISSTNSRHKSMTNFHQVSIDNNSFNFLSNLLINQQLMKRYQVISLSQIYPVISFSYTQSVHHFW